MAQQVTTRSLPATTSPQSVIEATDRALARNANEKEAVMYATILLESYHGTAATQGDATTMLRQFVDLFMHYPPAALKKATSAYDGLPARTEWKPSIKAAREFLDDHVAWLKTQRDNARAALRKPEPAKEKEVISEARRAQLDAEYQRVRKKLVMASAADPIHRSRHAPKGEINPEEAAPDGVD